MMLLKIEGDIVGEKRRNRKSHKAGLPLNETTFQTALLEINKPTRKYKLSSVDKITETEEEEIFD